MLSIFKTDSYKINHINQYPKGTEYIYANLTQRNLKWFKQHCVGYNDNTFLVSENLQRYIIRKLKEEWENNFFKIKWEDVEKEIKVFENHTNISLQHIIGDYKKLHQLGYLPLKINGIGGDFYGEKYLKPNTPVMTIQNTLPEFYWLVNYIEVWLSSEYWSLMVVDNIADQLYNLSGKYIDKTFDEDWDTDIEVIKAQFHDFSQRGLSSTESAIKSGIAHLNHFRGSDNLPALMERVKYNDIFHIFNYDRVLESAIASEHSVMEYGGRENEIDVWNRLLELYPNQTLSIVSDTYNYWNVLTNILPQLKDKIIARDDNDPLVIRPDTGVPINILCGTDKPQLVGTEWEQAEIKGTLRLLDETFGHTLTKTGHKLLNKVRVLYGDSITPKTAKAIFKLVDKMGYSTANLILGVGSFCYQMNSRDTLGIAIKTTAIKIKGKEWEMLYKDPITDQGLKKSRKGFINVRENGEVIDNIPTPEALEQEQKEHGTLWFPLMNNK